MDASPSSCRGKGPCACPPRNTIRLGSVRGDADPDADKHKAPTSTQPLPLSLQDAGTPLLPDAVGKIVGAQCIAPLQFCQFIPYVGHSQDIAWMTGIGLDFAAQAADINPDEPYLAVILSSPYAF